MNKKLKYGCDDDFLNHRLRAVAGPKKAGFYGYDGNGNRVWKLTGTCDAEWQNGGVIVYRAILDDAVLYPNPYITITPQGYTKHYYIGQERIASATGGGRWDVTPDHLNNREADIIDDYWGHYTSNNPFEEVSGGKTDNENLAGNTPSVLQYDCAPSQLFRLGLKWEDDILSSCINTYLQYSGSETTYFTHNDHLGSASWITDPHGYPIQYIHYAPYGELLANQRSTTFDERYKFTGKERDAETDSKPNECLHLQFGAAKVGYMSKANVETGYDYFGARFLAQQLGIWLSVDPLADKYIYATPYMYCNGNPVKYVDPDGNAIHVAVGAIIGAVIGGTISGIAAMNDPSTSRRQVLGAIAGGAISGAITGATTAVTGGLNLTVGGAAALSAIMGGIGEAAGSAVSQGIGNGDVEGGEVLRAGLVGAAAGSVTGATSKGVSEIVKKSGVVKNIEKSLLNEVKSGTGKAAKQQANQMRKTITNFCSPGNNKQFQMKDIITAPADFVGQEISTGVTTSEPVVEKTSEVLPDW